MECEQTPNQAIRQKGEPRQLKELRNLMPWTWDSKVEHHPPGAAALRDFQECDFQNWSSRMRRSSQPPTPVTSIRRRSTPDSRRRTGRSGVAGDGSPLVRDDVENAGVQLSLPRKPHSVGEQGAWVSQCTAPSNSSQREYDVSPQPPASMGIKIADPVARPSRVPARDVHQGLSGRAPSPADDRQNGTGSSASRDGTSASPRSPCSKETSGDGMPREQSVPSSCRPERASGRVGERRGTGVIVPQLTTSPEEADGAAEQGGIGPKGASGHGTANLPGSRAAARMLLSAGKSKVELNPTLASAGGRRSVMDVLVDAQLLAAAAFPHKAQQLLARPLHQAEGPKTDKRIQSMERQAPEKKAAPEGAGRQPSRKRPSSSMDGDLAQPVTELPHQEKLPGGESAEKLQYVEQRRAAEEHGSKRLAVADRQQPHRADKHDDLCVAAGVDPAMQVHQPLILSPAGEPAHKQPADIGEVSASSNQVLVGTKRLVSCREDSRLSTDAAKQVAACKAAEPAANAQQQQADEEEKSQEHSTKRRSLSPQVDARLSARAASLPPHKCERAEAPPASSREPTEQAQVDLGRAAPGRKRPSSAREDSKRRKQKPAARAKEAPGWTAEHRRSERLLAQQMPKKMYPVPAPRVSNSVLRPRCIAPQGAAHSQLHIWEACQILFDMKGLKPLAAAEAIQAQRVHTGLVETRGRSRPQEEARLQPEDEEFYARPDRLTKEEAPALWRGLHLLEKLRGGEPVSWEGRLPLN